MSLINQVLKDLEQRHASEMAEATHNLDGLAMAAPVSEKSSGGKKWFVAVTIFCVALILVWLAWTQYSTHRELLSAHVQSSSALIKQPKAVTVTRTKQTPAPKLVKENSRVQARARKNSSASVKRHSKPLTRLARRKPVFTQASQGRMEMRRVPLGAAQRAAIAYQSGYDQIELHHMQRAEEELRRALRIDPTLSRARELLAGLLIKEGRWVETANLVQTGIEMQPKNLLFIKLYARILMQLNRDAQAITMLRDHAPSVTQNPDYYALLAALYQREQEQPAAARLYTQILKVRPDNGIWWVGLGISLEKMGKQRAAQQAYARAQKTGTLTGNLARYTNNRLLALDAINYPIN